MKRRSLFVAAVLAASATLLLTACGGGDDKSSDNDKIAGADQGADSPRKTAEAPKGSSSEESDGVNLSLPSDVKLVFDWDKPKKANEAAAMDGAANLFRTIYHGVDKRTAKDPAVTAYATSSGMKYAKTQIEAWIEGGWTATGTLRHYDASTRSSENGTSVEVAFCADASQFYGKEVKTGKVLTTEPSVEDFDHYKITMVKHPTAEGLWQASKVFVATKARKCQ
ncbi:hypothetical protein [Streptomyces olivaceus]|uniref:hypothetical protein n=1 Tax=Streptomyces olivaceus TaxID=47716 RepID=UPI0036E49779